MSPTMPLDQLADEIIRLSQRNASTPVLVTPHYLSLRQQFFLELVGALVEKTSRSIRFDWYRDMPGLFGLVSHRIALARASRINRVLKSCLSQRELTAAIQITASITRPGGLHRDLSIGLCDQRLELPSWTTPIRLGSSPSELAALQSTPLAGC